MGKIELFHGFIYPQLWLLDLLDLGHTGKVLGQLRW